MALVLNVNLFFKPHRALDYATEKEVFRNLIFHITNQSLSREALL